LSCSFGQQWKSTLNSYVATGSGKGQVIANDLINIRDNNDPFGRQLSYTRQKLTNDDKNPFEIE
jgi:hypothetical protein